MDGPGRRWRRRAGRRRHVALPPDLHRAARDRRAHHAEAGMNILLKPAAGWRVFKSAISGWSADNCSSMGAAVAFYSLLSMAPLMMLVITIAGLAIGHDRAQELLFTQLSGLLGDTGAEGVRTMLDASNSQKSGLIATISSAVVLLLGATTVFAELQSDLNRIWKC